MILQGCFELEVSSNRSPDQRDSSEPKEWTIESKESHIMASGGTMWWKVCEIGFGTEYDWRIDVKVKWSGKWWMMESGEVLKMLQWLW